MRCEICEKGELETDDEIAMRACTACAAFYGLAPMPPPRRPARPCGACGGLRFIRAIPRQHSVDPSRTGFVQLSTPLLLTHLPATTGKTRKKRKAIDLRKGVGRFEVYLCSTCGFTEWFCRDVEAIPVHPHLMTDFVDYSGGSPYR